MRVLVTGATGFVGRHLLSALERAGHSLSLPLRDSSAAARLPSKIATDAHQISVVGSIDDQTDWSEALRDVDAVIHLAARAHVLDERAGDEEAFMLVNARGTSRLVEQSVDAGVRRFVLMSSIGAVTASSESLVTLDTPCRPQTPYGRSKLAGERALIDRCRSTTMAWTILRPTLVYGPGNPGNMGRLVGLVRRGLPLPLGAVANRRSFTFIENLVDVTTVALTHPNAAGGVFLLGDGEDLSTAELIRRIADLTGSRTRLISVPMPLLRSFARTADAVAGATGWSLPIDSATLRRLESSLYVDISPLRERLGWTPPVRVEEGLKRMLAAP
ncbi:MAG: NAD-dependent epimerase/dehydratase family protein, partial [Myxococcales bacterium]|nr:NAD-dependent epimerase/dehydratase family protein [Deltaproteobacteria bacterium]NNL24356.1 NAD-dependent epimerase/dehydratase family protein [Myxococcales bacterium]